MSKQAFSVIEILIVVFLILVAASIFIPLNMANVKEAELVSKWKNTFEEAKYSFELLRAQNPDLATSIIVDQKYDSRDAFRVVKKYLNIDKQKSTPEYFKNYKYRYLNGRHVNPHSTFYVKDFAVLESGVIIGFKVKDYVFAYGDLPIAIMLFDINGLEKPNRIGKDIFGVNIYKNDIRPFGDGHTHGALKANCSPIGTGIMCSKYYLIGGKF